jgi:tripartite-type tricarboxylate transporter receptor subunit TctC
MVIAPAGLPDQVLAKLNADCVAALKRPEVIEKHRVLGAEVVSSTPAEIRDFTESEMGKWGEAARKAGIVPQ